MSQPRILIVEDEYLVACDLAEGLRALGAEVVGPMPSIPKALDAVESGQQLDGAILDINLQGSMVFPVADELTARKVPFFFTTGYDEGVIPDRFAAVTRCEKPVSGPRLRQALAKSFALGS